jgi:hypothetical protein
MAVRTSSASVQGILTEYDSSISLTPFIDAASALVDRVSTLDTASVLTAAMLELIERWLAAHFYACADQLPSAESAGKSSTTWQGQTGMGLDFTQYGQMAKRLDFTGALASIDKHKSRPGISWLGQKAEDAEYDD